MAMKQVSLCPRCRAQVDHGSSCLHCGQQIAWETTDIAADSGVSNLDVAPLADPHSQPQSMVAPPPPPPSDQPQFAAAPPQNAHPQLAPAMPGGAQAWPGNGGYVMAPPRRTNPLAIAALVCGLFIGPLGVIFGHIALSQIKRTGDEGKGLAIAGLSIGYLYTAITIFWIIAAVAFVSSVSNGISSSY